MDRAEYLRRWSESHGDAATTGLVGWWLRRAHALARPLVRIGANPDAVTVAALAVALAALLPARSGGHWPVLAALLVAASGTLDNLDGAVAVMTGRTTRWGSLLDSVCDRIADAAFVAALWLSGAPGALAAAGAGIAVLHEYTRARAAVAGMSDIGVVTVSERPTRVIVTVMFLMGCGVYPSAGAQWSAAGASAWTVIGLAGLGQLLVVVRRRLR
jgi:phosphatidylglycerophosphate synthase